MTPSRWEPCHRIAKRTLLIGRNGADNRLVQKARPLTVTWVSSDREAMELPRWSVRTVNAPKWKSALAARA